MPKSDLTHYQSESNINTCFCLLGNPELGLRRGPEGIMWYAGRQERIYRILHGILEGRRGPEGIMWYAERQGWIQRVLHSILEDMGGSRGYYSVCRQGRILRVLHGMLEGRGGYRGYYVVCWKAGADL